jgi:hypothetical protein
MSYADYWYIRFPDGRILRAASTSVVRRDLVSGRIPLNSTVRRSPDDEWVSLEWVEEFADLSERPLKPPPAENRTPPRRRTTGSTAAPATVASRLDPARLKLVGVQAYLRELQSALDSTLTGKKLLVAGLTGLALGLAMRFDIAVVLSPTSSWPLLAAGVAAVTLLLVSVAAGLLTQLMYIELSLLRPARWREGLHGLERLTLRLMLALGFLAGLTWALIAFLRWMPIWLLPGGETAANPVREAAAGVALVVGMVLEIGLWPFFFFAWLVVPILVVEDCSAVRALRLWLAFLRRNLVRIFLYQAMAVGLGILVTVPFVLMVLPLYGWPVAERLLPLAHWTRAVLIGLAGGPLLAYWIVSNVFIYLNLRYASNAEIRMQHAE